MATVKKNLVVLCAMAALLSVASAQQVNSQTNVSASNNTSVSAAQNGANASSESNANASSNTSVAAPQHDHDQDRKETKRGDQKKDHDQKGGSMDASSALAAGTTVNAVLSKPLDSRKCKPGDKVVATASQDVKADGKVVVKKGSQLIGHVTEANAKADGQASSSLGIMFDQAIGKNGQQVQMNSVVQAIAAAQTSAATATSDDNMEAMGNSSVATSGATRGGSGLLGGVNSTASGAAHAVANVGGTATGTVNSTLNSTAHTGNAVGGVLNSNTSGVVGLKGLSLATDASNATQGSVITSSGKSVHLDSGTQMVLRVVNQ